MSASSKNTTGSTRMPLSQQRKWPCLLALAILIVVGTLFSFLLWYFSDRTGTEILLAPKPLNTLHDTALYLTNSLTDRTELLSLNQHGMLNSLDPEALESGLLFIFWGMATLLVALGTLSWLPLSNEALFNKEVTAPMPHKVISLVFVIISIAVAVMFLAVLWNLLPIISSIGSNPNLVWKSSPDVQVGGIGLIVGCIGALILTALLLIPAFVSLGAILKKKSREAPAK
jgi:magnesium-transporting ATPase (P-type)